MALVLFKETLITTCSLSDRGNDLLLDIREIHKKANFLSNLRPLFDCSNEFPLFFLLTFDLKWYRNVYNSRKIQSVLKVQKTSPDDDIQVENCRLNKTK